MTRGMPLYHERAFPLKRMTHLKRFFLVLVMVITLANAAPAQALTDAELQAEIQRLLALLSALQQQLAQLQGGGSISTPTPGGSCPALTRRLAIGAEGGDVSALQQFLRGTGDYTGAEITTFFGPATENAVKQFQCRNNIICSGTGETTGYGAVGPATRSAIVRACSLPATPSCYVGSTPLAAGETRAFYASAVVPSGSVCQFVQRTCINGTVSGNPTYQFATCTITAPVACNVAGLTIPHGAAQKLYMRTSVPFGQSCETFAQLRTCANGVLSGDPNFYNASCSSPSSPANCEVRGEIVAHGASKKFYSKSSVLVGQSCEPFAQTRVCNNGAMSGGSEYEYASCSVSTARSCTYGGVTIPHDTDRTFYTVGSVAYNQSCTELGRSQVGHCNDGTFAIPAQYKFATCAVTPEKTCALDGIVYPGGTSRAFYSTAIAPTGHACTEYDQVRKCTNGVWNGTATYNKAVCAPAGQAYCRLGSTYVAHTKTITAYYLNVVPFGNTCAQYDQVRTCWNGALGGSYAYTSCSVTAPKSCTLDGKTVTHDNSSTFYSVEQAPSGQTCAMNAQTRACYDGVLSGSSDFKYKACTN